MKELYSTQEAAEFLGIKSQSVTIAIAQKRLKAKKIGNKWFIEKNDMVQFADSKWKRLKPIPAGLITVIKASKKYKVSVNTIYHFLHYNKVKYKKLGTDPITFKEQDFVKYLSVREDKERNRIAKKNQIKLKQDQKAQRRRTIA